MFLDPVLGIIISVSAILFIALLFFLTRYRRCPSDKILVIYGQGVGRTGESAKCIHGGGALVWPVIQSFGYLNLTPISIEVDLKKALSKQNIRVDVPSSFTVAISTEPEIMRNAAERLFGLKKENIESLAKEIILGQLRLVVATMNIEELNADRDKFLVAIAQNVETELKKIGLRLINVTDIKDESGYIEALGQEAAAHAINEAKKLVAEKERDGEIGKAEAEKEKRIKISQANAAAIQGENEAKISVAESDAIRREKEAEAIKRAISAEKVQAAKALEEAYRAEQITEVVRAEKVKAEQTADIVIPAEINKQKVEIDAEADAERIRRKAKGEADGIYYKMDAEARGIGDYIKNQAEGFAKLITASENDAQKAALLLIADKLPELVKYQSEAIKNIKLDKVIVWDNGGSDGDNKTSTANFISGMYQSVPPLNEMFNMAGLQLPSFLGKKLDEMEEKEKRNVVVQESNTGINDDIDEDKE
ncbi:flotillin family protein [Sebaldella sp. S0638]|uniref:flotillin family protein n=1 Tax=Sebaldella sp. S0638 TaxID=2957809 RepID=UPI00209ED986|nr:flotillin family protein [Sebaldella sp. S0638]MCP1224990.1 SPFH domain-containing protein [Sebaldella sp. S0638]